MLKRTPRVGHYHHCQDAPLLLLQALYKLQPWLNLQSKSVGDHQHDILVLTKAFRVVGILGLLWDVISLPCLTHCPPLLDQ